MAVFKRGGWLFRLPRAVLVIEESLKDGNGHAKPRDCGFRLYSRRGAIKARQPCAIETGIMLESAYRSEVG